MRITTKQRYMMIAFLLFGLIVVVGAVTFYTTQRAFIHDELVALYLLPRPEKMTELYFSDSSNLPSFVTRNSATTVGSSQIQFDFVVHNLEATDYNYHYEVYINARGTKRIIDSGLVLVKDNQYFVKKEQFNLLNSPGRQEVVVALTNKHQAIDFWVQFQQ